MRPTDPEYRRFHYFDLAVPKYDPTLQRLKRENPDVPRGCLAAGFVVAHQIYSGRHPCDGCPCPKRDVCGGKMFAKRELPTSVGRTRR